MRFFPLSFAAVVSLSLPVWTLADSSATSPTSAPVIDLTPGNVPAVSAADAVDVVREGTHVVGRTGRLAHTPDGQQAMFVFDDNAANTPSPPMIVLPNLELFLMEGVSTIRIAPVEFRISGTVTEYKGRNYILVDNAHTTPQAAATGITAAAPEPQKAVEPPQPPATEPLRHVTFAAPGEPAVSKMDRLLASTPESGQELPAGLDNTPTTNAATGSAAVAPGAPELKVVREGTHLINRMGRLNHTPDGQKAVLTFETDGKTMCDPPMIMLPNSILFSMEGQVVGRAGDLRFRVSGTVTEYKGRNYILLDKAVAMADAETPF